MYRGRLVNRSSSLVLSRILISGRSFCIACDPFYSRVSHFIFTPCVVLSRVAPSLRFLRIGFAKRKPVFTCKHSQQQFLISVGDTVLNSEASLRQWLCGFEYHRDETEAITLIKAHDPIPMDSSRPIFIMMLREKADAVLHLGHVVHKMLNPSPLAE